MRQPRYKLLKAEMYGQDIDQVYLAKQINRGQGYISERMSGRKSWELDECYTILEVLGIPTTEVAVYFPPILNNKEKKA